MAEIRLEQLLGRVVMAQNGRAVGRIEEVIAVEDADGCYIDEFHGRYARRENGSVAHHAFDCQKIGHGKSYRVPWNKLELSRPSGRTRFVRWTICSSSSRIEDGRPGTPRQCASNIPEIAEAK